GWAHSLSVRTDKHLKRLNGHSGFASLINRMKTMKGQFQPARGFRSHYIWTGGDEPLIIEAVESLDRYYLSTFLAYTGIRGNSAQEVLSYLGAAASSDGSSPDGTVYLLENRNIRALTRERYFHATVEALAERGRDAEILTKWQDGENGIIPQNKDDIIGAVVGAERFDWGSSKSRLLPGAIAESLTSYGGHFNKAKQTKLTEFLRHGAAGSSGAVVEPYAKQAKFPVSYLHVHYADGSSLAEAFYQSVEAPYQLIIVGDPLARPFAHFAKVRLLTPDPGQSWRGTVLIKSYVQAANGRTVGRVELWVDGQYVDDKPAGEVIPWDTIEVEDGSHDLRLVAVEATPMETRSYIRIPVKVANTGNRMAVDDVRKPVIFGDDIVLTGSASDARSVQLFQGVRLIGSADVESGRWKLHVPSRLLGPGDVILFMRVLFRDGTIYRSKPIDIHIEKPLLIKAGKHNGQSSKHGLEGVVKYKSGRNREIVIKKLNGRLKELGKDKKGVSFIRVEGEFNVKETGFYQLVVSTTGKIHIEVDYSVILDDELDKDDGDRFLPLSLESGWHSLKLELIPKGPPRIRVVMNGEQVAELLEGDMLRH
ncbi:MAG: hypothetical protein KAJ10_16235, partial [Thermodesulfovibrionia bacterium]|nr:hypothetical protein [Thermodesulfovibrionia bacterium]